MNRKIPKPNQKKPVNRTEKDIQKDRETRPKKDRSEKNRIEKERLEKRSDKKKTDGPIQ